MDLRLLFLDRHGEGAQAEKHERMCVGMVQDEGVQAVEG
jgi:hypothetical protein